MSARISKASLVAPDTKTTLSAYAGVTGVTGVVGYLVMSGAALWPNVAGTIGVYDAWMILAGALAGLAAMVIARGWLGMPGVLGAIRACFGALVMAILAALIGGSLIMPVYGTYYAPFVVLSAFIANPLWAVLWCGGVGVAHAVLSQAERRRLAILSKQEQQAQSSLSPLSQAYFYRK
ncbi:MULTISPECIES: hypothetical protein [unclassified Yoonia]|uniref:hypothetical protein n=1 Tax=unclassified Yoonia TaxID=2629118 RepID=UPI002AFE2CCC|nr:MULTISPECIES: hypothetical protein [unclassified Yoonia]